MSARNRSSSSRYVQDFDTKNDLNNFLTFLKALRAKLGKDKLISADTSAGVWVGSDGQPSKDLSAVRPSRSCPARFPADTVSSAQFAAVLDFITIMVRQRDPLSRRCSRLRRLHSCHPSAMRILSPFSLTTPPFVDLRLGNLFVESDGTQLRQSRCSVFRSGSSRRSLVQALDSSCAPTSNQFAIPSTVKAWIDAKFPANQVRLEAYFLVSH